MLEIHQLGFEYFNNPVFNNVDLTVSLGSIMHIKGANGAGKSTLLKCISGLLMPTSGDIKYQGASIIIKHSSYQQDICYIGHKLGINLNLSPKENIHYNYLGNVSEHQKINALNTLNLIGISETPCMQLSMGQKKRTSLLRLLLTEATIWLLDEPFVGLDVNTIACITNLIKTHAENGGTVLITSHQKLDFNSNNFCEYSL